MGRAIPARGIRGDRARRGPALRSFPTALLVSLALHASVSQVLPASQAATRARAAATRSIEVSLVRLPPDEWAARLAPGSPSGSPQDAATRAAGLTAGRTVGRVRPAAAPAPSVAPPGAQEPAPEHEVLRGEPIRPVTEVAASPGIGTPGIATSPAGSGGVRGAGEPGGHAAGPVAARPADLTAVRSGVFRTLRYPDEARRRRLQGRVELEFVLLADGRVRELGVRSSSGHGILDGAAVSAIESAAPFDPPGMDVVVVLPVSFRGD